MPNLKFLPCLAAVLLAGCDHSVPTVASAQAAIVQSATLIGYGSASDQVGFERAMSEAQAKGPSAIAVDANGHSIIVDRLNHRVLRLGARVETIAAAAEDTDLIAVAPDGAIGLYSALHARIAIVANGATIGELAVPRVLGEIQSFSIGASRRVTITNALQERYELGSPSFPLALPVMLATRREGAVALPEHRGAAVIVERGQATLRIFDPASERVSRPVASIALSGRVDAAQLVGVDGAVACVRAEMLSGDHVIDVVRRVICIDTTTQTVRLDQALAAPGVYAPRAELAVGAGGVAIMRPDREGLSLAFLSFATGGAR